MILAPKQAWLQLTSRYTSDPTLQLQLWLELEQLYTSAGRHYHTLQHINSLLQLSAQFEEQILQLDLFQFAIFYHDAIYEPLRYDNEEQSADLARRRLHQLGLPEPEVELVTQLIMATKTHQSLALPDANLLLDFDLAILAAPHEQYTQYTCQVREEYKMVPETEYRKGRIKVLQRFLSQENIYKTEGIRQEYECQARNNLQQEIKRLQKV